MLTDPKMTGDGGGETNGNAADDEPSRGSLEHTSAAAEHDKEEAPENEIGEKYAIYRDKNVREGDGTDGELSLIHISEPTRQEAPSPRDKRQSRMPSSA